MTWTYLGWCLVASCLALTVSELLRRRERTKNELYYWTALGASQAEIEALKRATRAKD